MDSIASNGLNYKGIVNISINKGNKSYSVPLQNSGTEYLGEFISKALSGYYVNNISSMQTDSPTWFNLEYYDTSNNWQPLLKNVLPLTGTTYGKDTSDSKNILGKVTYVVSLQSSGVILRTGISNRNMRITLYNNRVPKQVLATIEGSNPGDPTNTTLHTLYDALTSGQDSMVKWVMMIINSTN